jgi:hypothetical protein
MPSKIQRVRISSGAIAADGTATAYSSPICGKILAVEIDYPAATCTVDIDTDGELKAQKILDLAAANTDVALYPRVNVCDNTGAATIIYGTGNEVATEFVVNGRLKLAIASGTATQVVTVDVFYEAF